MLGPMLTSIHNLHYYLNLMAEVRAALDAGQLSAFVTQFRTDRARGV
jgi:queuine tRNA-ribosyltransferase